MLKVTNKKYEIEEKIQLTKIIDNEEKVAYEFDMQITEEELRQIENILFGFARKNKAKYTSATIDEKNDLENQAEEEIRKNDELFVNICFKEHKEEFKKLAGEYKFEEMVASIRGYMIDFFMKKQILPLNSTLTNLTKTFNSLPKFK